MTIKSKDGVKLYPIADRMFSSYMATYIGETRPPKKGEYFLSGAQPEAYEALNDMSRAYPIVTIVKVKQRLIKEYTILDDKEK